MRQQNGIVVRLTKAWQERNLLSEACINLARAYPRTISKQRSGIAEPLTKGSTTLSTILEECTS